MFHSLFKATANKNRDPSALFVSDQTILLDNFCFGITQVANFMSFRFVTQKLTTGLYEPEGIYLQTPFEGVATIGQGWGENTEIYNEFQYNTIPLKGHNGVDFIVPGHSKIFSVDRGRVVEVGIERGGYERYIKVEHPWGESFYAFLNEILVDSGQILERGETIATVSSTKETLSFFHFSIRIPPFNRLDGWGGFIDPLPYMNPADIQFPENGFEGSDAKTVKHGMLTEKAHSRRP